MFDFDFVVHVSYSLGDMQIRVETVPEGVADAKEVEKALTMLGYNIKNFKK